MQINSVNTYNNNRQTFCARVPQNIQNAVLRQAVEGGTESLNRAKAQIAKVQNWGKPTTVLETAFDMAEKAMKNKNLMIKIAGEENPTATKFFEAVDKLSEEEIVNLRFNLDEPSKFSDGPILNFEF